MARGRRYVRDSKGRFAAKGYSGQTSGTGSRLKAGGKKRAGGGKVVSPKRMSGAPSNTISKSSSKRKVNASSRKVEAQIKRDVAARQARKKPNVVANNARATGGLKKPVSSSNIRRTNSRLGPYNNVRSGPKSPTTKYNKAIDAAPKKGKSLKGKIRDLKKQTDALRDKFLKEDKKRMQKAFDKPSAKDKRSRDYFGRLTKEGKRQDPGTGGKKKRKRKPKK